GCTARRPSRSRAECWRARRSRRGCVSITAASKRSTSARQSPRKRRPRREKKSPELALAKVGLHKERCSMVWKRLVRAARPRSAPLTVESLEARTVLSTATPYVVPANPAVDVRSILTTGDSVGTYRMAGIPDGLGAFDNGNGTFTVLMNHE